MSYPWGAICCNRVLLQSYSLEVPCSLLSLWRNSWMSLWSFLVVSLARFVDLSVIEKGRTFVNILALIHGYSLVCCLEPHGEGLPWGFWWPSHSSLVVLWVGPFFSLKCCRTSLVFWYISVQSLPTVFSPSSSQILLVTAMYLVRGTLEELTANLGPFCRSDYSPSLRGLLDKLMTHFFLMMSGTGVFPVSWLFFVAKWIF